MHSKKIFLFMLFLCTVFSGRIFSGDKDNDFEQLTEVDFSILNWVGDRVYFNADQFILSDKGIFVLIQDSCGLLTKVLVSQVNFDDTGLFILAENLPSPQMGFCRYGHPTCRTCGRCAHPGCPTPPCRCRGR